MAEPRLDANEALLRLHPAGNKIMYVDDDSEPLRRSFIRAISPLFPDFEIVSADDGSTALEQIQGEHSGRIALLISDVIMPMDGPTLVREVRKDRGGKALLPTTDVPILFLSGYTGSAGEDVKALVASGDVAELLLKPWDINDLLDAVVAAVEKTLEKRREAEEA